MHKNRVYDVFINGGGIVGCANAWALTFSNIENVIVAEKNREVALVNSNTESNAQTLHGGDTETNFVPEKALKMREAERLLGAFVEKFAPDAFRRLYKMALGVNKEEVLLLEKRYELLKEHYPGLRLLLREDIKKIEPILLEGREPNELVAALYRKDGYAIDYHRVALAFRREAEKSGKVEFVFGTKVKKIRKHGDIFEIETNNDTFLARSVIVSAGPYSLRYAKEFNAHDAKNSMAREYTILPVAGSFYKTKCLISGKIYPVQDPKFPFARAHADPAMHNPTEMRLGPTAKMVPMFERHHWMTVWDFLWSGLLSWRGIWSVIRLFRDPDMIRFVWKNFVYDIPVIGKKRFLETAKNIIPTLGYGDIEFVKGAGGIRPQLINMKTGELEMGTGKFIGDKCIFNITPSPGASDSLRNAVIDAKKTAEFLGSRFRFDEVRFNETLLGKERIK